MPDDRSLFRLMPPEVPAPALNPNEPGTLFRSLAANAGFSYRVEIQYADYQAVLAEIRVGLDTLRERLDFHELETHALAGIHKPIDKYLADLVRIRELIGEANALDQNDVKRRTAWDQWHRHRAGGVG